MEPVFIVAQYKSGTSWLLSSLSAHPDVTGIAEIDIVRAAYEIDDRTIKQASADHRLKRFFGMSAWCRDDARQQLALGEHGEPDALDLSRPQMFADLAPEAAVGLYRTVSAEPDPHRVLDAFMTAVSERAAGTHLVLKAADQIWVFDALQEWQPSAKKIAITRDGRDAVISAEHYRRLMQSEAAPWFGGSASYERLLRGWARRAALIAELGRSGKIFVLRYEDLSRDFVSFFGNVLAWLGLEHTNETIAAIEAQTSFEARTGRPRGTEGTGVLRKGAVGEWRTVMDQETAAWAWDVAGEELAALGYTEDDSLNPLPGDIAPPDLFGAR